MIENAVEWAREHKRAVIIGGAAAGLLVVVLYLRHRSGKTASDTAGTTGALTDGGGQYLVPYTPATDPSAYDGSYGGGDSGQLGDVLAALNDLTTTDAGLASGLGDLTDSLGTIGQKLDNLTPVKSTNPNGHKGKGGKNKNHHHHGAKGGGHAQHGKTKTKNPTPGGHAHGGHTGHTNDSKHHEPTTKLVNPRRPKGPTAAQRKAGSGHKAHAGPHKRPHKKAA